MEDRKLTILFGSQTGTAQEIAERIWRESKRFHFHGPVQAMDDYPVAQLIYESLVIFVCSTTGQGEEPDNMKQFWRFLLRKSLPVDSLKGLRFSVLGLGDSSYSKFNYAAKKLARRLLQLGGEIMNSVGLADDQHDLGYSAVTDPWINHNWSKLMKAYPLPNGLQLLSQDFWSPPRWKISVVKLDHEHNQHGEVAMGDKRSGAELDPLESSKTEAVVADRMECDDLTREPKYCQTNPCIVTVLKNTRTTAETHFQDVRLVELSAPELSYVPGDVVSVVPHNPPSSVEKLFSLLSTNKTARLTPDDKVHVSQHDADMPVPKQLERSLALKECAEKYWDLNAVPKRYFFQLLSHFTTSHLEKEKLVEFTTPEGQEDLYNYAHRPRRTCLETLEDFPHATDHVPLEYLFELFQPIRPRSFSIASSPTAHQQQIHVLVAVVQYKTKLVKPRFGLCSNWLANLSVGDRIPVWTRSGSFRFPLDTDETVLMIGPGTGVAPFRSFIHERVALGCAKNDQLILLFGCRNKEGDLHCRDEWTDMIANSQLNMLCAFSRDQEHKIYVQHLIREHSSFLWDLISDKKALIFLAGSSKNMPTAVRDALMFNVLVDKGSMPLPEAKQSMARWERNGRFQSETWS